MIYETQVGALPPFKLELIVELATAGRFAEARSLAEPSSLLSGPGMAMATALAVAGPSVTEEALRETASSLIDAVDAVEPGPLATPTLGAVMRTLTSRALHSEAARLAQKLVPRPGLWSAVGIWALDRARAGEADQVRALIRRLLVERPMPVADARARAAVLTAVAGRRGSASDELEGAVTLLSDARVAAPALDVVFEVTDLIARHRGVEAAATFARSVADGRAAELAEEFLRSREIRWEGEPSQQDIAAAAAARAVAAAGMVMASSRNGRDPAESREWLQRAQALTGQAKRMIPGRAWTQPSESMSPLPRPNCWTDRRRWKSPTTPGRCSRPPGWSGNGAALCGGRLRHAAASKLAIRSQGHPQIMSADEILRRNDVFNAVRAGLHALVAVVAADSGDRPRRTPPGPPPRSSRMAALSPAEQVQIGACLAIGLHHARAEEAATEQLKKAVEPAFTLARRGELAPFARLCQALLELLPADRAALTWAEWLTAAASVGTDEALRLIAAYIRWIPQDDLRNVAVSVQTGQLGSRSPE